MTIGPDITRDQLNPSIFAEEKENIAFISIIYSDFNELQEIKELQLQVPLTGG